MLFSDDNGLALLKYNEHWTMEREASEDKQLASRIFSNDNIATYSPKPLEFPCSVYGTMILTDKFQ